MPHPLASNLPPLCHATHDISPRWGESCPLGEVAFAEQMTERAANESTPCGFVGVDAHIDPRLSGHFRMLTAACRQAALQHHRRPSLELVGGGVHDAPLHRAVPQGDFLALCAHSVDKRRPLQGLRNALGLVVGRGALTPPRTVAHRPLAPLVRGAGFLRSKKTEG